MKKEERQSPLGPSEEIRIRHNCVLVALQATRVAVSVDGVIAEAQKIYRFCEAGEFPTLEVAKK